MFGAMVVHRPRLERRRNALRFLLDEAPGGRGDLSGDSGPESDHRLLARACAERLNAMVPKYKKIKDEDFKKQDAAYDKWAAILLEAI